MPKLSYIITLFLAGCLMSFSQRTNSGERFFVEGSVKGKERRTPISGVEITTKAGGYTVTNGLGEFKIQVSIGDELIVRDAAFETVRYTINSREDIDILVEGYSVTKSSRSQGVREKKTISLHQGYLDSAEIYKKTNIEKSIDYITQSIAQLSKKGDKTQLAASLTKLGEVYEYHQQYDLAVENYEDALEAKKSTRTTILLGNAYLKKGEYKNAQITFTSLTKIKGIIPYQSVQLYEGLGDAYKGLGEIDKSVANYNQGLLIAKKNQITPKLTDLNSKIADAYAGDDRNIEANAYFDNSLKLAKSEAPKRAIQEKDKVADFYNTKNRYDEEIALRKEALTELNTLSKPVPEERAPGAVADSITPQRINYKIANAYIAQNKLDEAIPYLQQSIVEADGDDDLVVQKDATRKLSEVYEYKGDFTKAYETFRKYAAVVDTLYIRKEQEISRAARFNREIASKQSRITGLEQERELTQSKYDLAVTAEQLTLESNKRQKWIIYSLIFGLFLMAVAAFFFYRANRQQKLANNLLALKSLRSQMNPHFIFNALNSVNNYIAKSDERSANRYLSEFSTLMRAVLENSEEDFIPLAKELELLELYVKLEHSRFPDKFDYNILIDEHIDISAFQIPPMLLQPYIVL